MTLRSATRCWENGYVCTTGRWQSISRTVYVTEGILKAYIAHGVMNRTFISTAGSNSIDQLRPMFQFLAQNGTELIIEAEDMDKYSNEAVA